jgi:D-tagatose 6-phosphate 4-epimerase
MAVNPLADIASWKNEARFRGIPSICSANPLVIEAAMLEAAAAESLLLIEATCNQVNQDGGYTGMTPSQFRRFVEDIARMSGFPIERLILGGDHLGPNPWRHLPAEEAMGKAIVMIDSYARAGFIKLHLDTSMGCAGEPAALADALTAERAARLAAVVEAAVAKREERRPSYVIGTEVPVPGGAMEQLVELKVTDPAAMQQTVELHKRSFGAHGLEAAFDRVIAVVVQPGVEYGNLNVVAYDRHKAVSLCAGLAGLPGFVFEAHSTDYQRAQALAELVDDGFAILKVGPGLTFALREALYALDLIANFLRPGSRTQTLFSVMEHALMGDPRHWEKYYRGTPEELRLQRHFSYSDRIRYYWPEGAVASAVNELFSVLEAVAIPKTMISQYMGSLYPAVLSGFVELRAKALAIAAVRVVLKDYFDACRLRNGAR